MVSQMIADRGTAAPAPRRYTYQRRDRNALFWLFCLSSALDFRGQTAGGTIQIALFLVSTIAFVLILLRTTRPNISENQLLFRVTFAWWLYLIASFPVAMYWGVSLVNYTKAFIPSLLMGESLLIGLLLLSRAPESHGMIIDATYWSCLISSIVFLINGLYFLGYTIDNARFHITSPLLASLFAISLWRYLWSQSRLRLLYLSSCIFSLTIMYLSLTRTYIAVTILVMVSIVPVLAFGNAWLSSAFREQTLRRVFGLGGVVLIVGFVILSLFPTFTTRWGARTQAIGEQDPSALSRLAEAAGEIEQMRSSAGRFLLGSGIGSDHIMDNVYLKESAAWAGDTTVNDAIFEPGHVLWPYQFYATGIFFGTWLFVIMTLAVWRGVSAQMSYFPFIAASALVGVFGESMFGNILGARSGGAMLGLLIVVAISSEGRVSPRRDAAGWSIRTR